MAFPLGWQRVCPLVIPHAQVAGGNIAGLPVVITRPCLPAEMVTLAGANAAQADGGDIRFSADPGGRTQLPCEIVTWVQNATPSLAVAEIWVTIPNLSGIYNVSIYVWYKAATTQTQPAAGAAFGSQAVWDSDYKFVWHGGDGTTLGLNDSTVNANNLTNTGAVAAVAGQVGGAGAFTGGNKLTKTSPTGIPTSGAITIEAWIYLTNASAARYALAASLYTGAEASLISIASATSRQLYAYLGFLARATTAVVALNTWVHVVFSYTTPSVQQYLNGALDTVTAISPYTFTAAPKILLGALDATSAAWEGRIDEVRISSVLRASGWIRTQYLNQSNPGAFMTPGTPYAPGAYSASLGFYGNNLQQ